MPDRAEAIRATERHLDALDRMNAYAGITAERDEIIREAKRAGWSGREIAAKMRLSRPTVDDVIKKMKGRGMGITDAEIRTLWDSLNGRDTEMAAVCYLAVHGEMPPADPEETGWTELTGTERARVAALTQDQARAECGRVIAEAHEVKAKP